MKIFISSLIKGYEDYRAAAARAIRGLGYEPVLAEDSAARSTSPQRACLDDVRAADAVVLLLGARYGVRQSSGLSATHEEFREAHERCPILAFVEAGVEVDTEQEEFLQEVRKWQGGNLTANYSNPEGLQDAVIGALHRLVIEQERGSADQEEMLDRALHLLPVARRKSGPALQLSVASGPQQQVIRPKDLYSEELARWLKRELLFGEYPLFGTERGTQTLEIESARVVEQSDRAFHLREDGSVAISLPIHSSTGADPFGVSGLVEEDICDLVERMVRFVGVVLEHIDPNARLSESVPVALMRNAGFFAWRRRDESRPGGGIPVALGAEDTGSVHLTPPARKRASLLQKSRELAEDLTVLLRRSRAAL